jgi:hypothetical protein
MAWVAVIIAVILSLPVEAKKIPSELHWSELAAVVTGEEIAVAPPSAPPVIGRVVAVEPDALRLQTKMGQIRILRLSVAIIELRQMRKRGRIIGVSAGAVLGLVSAVLIDFANCGIFFNAHACGSGTRVAEVAVGVGIPVAGYFIGRWADRTNSRITILPD